jgi:MFS transporter, MHS family, shikimate and dehydroshikimate transport protein
VVTTSTGAAAPRTNMKRVAFASFMGSAIEWYDFFIFGTAAALVFGKLFFPSSDPLSGTLLAFGTFGVGFFARPIGGIIGGHMGDRIGRKKTLVITLLLMGFATTLIGVLPTREMIGIAAPILLVILRIAQGLGVGGEWGGAALIAVEHAPKNRRGFFGSFPQLGVPAGLLLATSAFALVTQLPEDALLSWGWRLPFLASIALVIVGFLIRLGIEDPKVFKDLQATHHEAKAPIIQVLKNDWRNVLLAAGIRFADNALYYVCATFVLTYMTSTLGLPRSQALTGVLVAAALELLTMPLFGALSDKIGRRPVVIGGAALGLIFAFPYFMLIDTGATWAILVASVIAISVAHSAVFSPLSAWFSEMFGTGVRYSGVSLGFQLGALAAGAPVPFLATALLVGSAGAPWPIAIMIAVACTVTLVCALIARDRSINKATHTAPAVDPLVVDPDTEVAAAR